MIKILREDNNSCAYTEGETEEEKAKIKEWLEWRKKSPIERIEIRAAELMKEGYKVSGKLEGEYIKNAFKANAKRYTLIMVKNA